MSAVMASTASRPSIALRHEGGLKPAGHARSLRVRFSKAMSIFAVFHDSYLHFTGRLVFTELSEVQVGWTVN